MSVVEAKIQTVEDMYRLIWTAVAKQHPISAIYKELPRLFCPHRLGRNRGAAYAAITLGAALPACAVGFLVGQAVGQA